MKCRNKELEIYPIPFFVADRPMSLKLLKFCGIDELPFKVGIMGHANTSKNFQRMFKDFKGKNIVKMADSAVFTKKGCIFDDYEKLFETYEKMGVKYGVMIDVLKDKNKTLKSAKKAMELYKSQDYDFNLVGVAQGKNINEYLECYKKLKAMGFKYIGIGGLLKKIENSSRYVKVQNEDFLKDVIKKIREIYPRDWLFILGCFHPKRIKFFRKYRVFGSDYKGWILNYKPPTEEEKRIKRKEELRRYRFIQIKRYLFENVFSNYVEWNKKLLIVSCSKRKKAVSGLLPAVDLYEGPQFKIIRRYLDMPNLDVYIISAKYGVVKYSDHITYYDMKMTVKRANELKGRVSKALRSLINENNYSDVLINLGKNYLYALDGFRADSTERENSKITFLEGRIGERLKKMKEWLETIKGGDMIE